MTTKGLAVLGSTGTIGANTLAIVDAFPDRFRVVSLSGGKNVDRVREQIAKYRPTVVAVAEASSAAALRNEFPDIRIESGESGLAVCVEAPGVDVVVMGIVGFAALAPTLAAAKAGRTIALANKESLIVAGTLVRREAERGGATILPVDSEHNAIFQLLAGTPRDHVASIVLTASGGPLLRRPEVPLDDVTPAMATAHPNWKMGPKISVDSATLMNKGLELIEAHYLFDMPEDRIEVWVHPQSIVHGAVWLTDNSCLAQLTKPDMRSSIGYALAYPERLPRVIPKLGLREMSNLEFLEPDTQRFPALRLAREALRAGAGSLVALNAANEIAVESFLRGELLFSRIPAVLSATLDGLAPAAPQNVEAIYELDARARSFAREEISRKRG